MDDREPQIEIIGALRGLAALSVAWFHFTNGEGLLQSGWLKSSGAHGWLKEILRAACGDSEDPRFLEVEHDARFEGCVTVQCRK